MGEVWIAEHAMLARPAAIKLIRVRSFSTARIEVGPPHRRSNGSGARPARSRACDRDTRSAIYDFGVADDGALFYVMELLDGVDLDTLVKGGGPTPPRRAVEILLQATSSLGEAHSRGVIHRDVKPANLFLCRQADELDVVKVLDFGMARDLTARDPNLTTDGDFVGTPACMAPEQVRGSKDIDGRADIYALACVAYWMLAGRYVFEQDTAMAVAMAHVTEAPQSLAAVTDAPVPEALDQLILRCLAKEPDDRPADMATLRADLEAILRDMPEDGWTAPMRREWWKRVPSHFDEPTETQESVRLSPKRTA